MYTDINVQLVDCMGDDLSVVNAARVSFNKFKHQEDCDPSDEKLIKYLADHDHWSPFGHAFLSFRIKAPIFVARQLVKHQVGLCWNEVSRHYVKDSVEFYVPDEWRAAPTDGAKQGSSDGSNLDSDDLYMTLVSSCVEAANAYNGLLNAGVAPEMARMVLPLNTMTEWIWSGSLMAFARVCKLRLDSHSQPETGRVAELISSHVELKFPISWRALVQNA